jgi:hypothetical protein
MAEYDWDYGDDAPYDDWSWQRGGAGKDFFKSDAWKSFTGWDGDETQQDWFKNANLDTEGEGGNGGIMSILSPLGPTALKALVPLISGSAALAGGNRGADASREASRLQSDALQRGINLQEAQWVTQQANQEPWLRAGREALPELQRMAKEGAGDPFSAPNTPIWGQHAGYAPPSATPGWTPQDYEGPASVNAGDFRWTPGQGPRAADYRYTPGAVPTLQGEELLANDPGVRFRLDEGRKALEASALARGTGMSGSTLAALQRHGQELGSQEYGAAWNRASQQAQMREQWNQFATQQGWSQAESEARFREAMAQGSSQQGFQQAMAGQAQDFGQGLQRSQWNQGQRQQFDQERYGREAAQAEQRYGRDVSENQQTYDRALQAWNSRNAQRTTDWNRQSTLAGLAQTATNQVGNQGLVAQDNISRLLTQQGVAQATAPAASALQQTRGMTSAVAQLPSLLASLNL